jgi:hypothetical protein
MRLWRVASLCEVMRRWRVISHKIFVRKGNIFFRDTQISLIFCGKIGDFRADFVEKCKKMLVFQTILAFLKKLFPCCPP